MRATVRVRKRRDDPYNRRWFAVLRGCGFGDFGKANIIRIFFPWFYVDVLTPYTKHF